MGLVLAMLVCVVAFVLPCIIVASSRPLRTGRRDRRGVLASSEDTYRPTTAVALTEKWWFKLGRAAIGPAAVVVFLVCSIRNVQNGVAWNDPSWAFILPFGIVISVVLLSQAKWEWTPVIDDAPPRLPWQIILGKATAKFLAVVISGVVVSDLVAISLDTWPDLNTHVREAGLVHFAASVRHNTETLVGGLGVLFVLLYWQTNTVTRPEYVWPDGTPVVGARYPAAASTPTTKASSAYVVESRGGSAAFGRWHSLLS